MVLPDGDVVIQDYVVLPGGDPAVVVLPGGDVVIQDYVVLPGGDVLVQDYVVLPGGDVVIQDYVVLPDGDVVIQDYVVVQSLCDYSVAMTLFTLFCCQFMELFILLLVSIFWLCLPTPCRLVGSVVNTVRLIHVTIDRELSAFASSKHVTIIKQCNI